MVLSTAERGRQREEEEDAKSDPVACRMQQKDSSFFSFTNMSEILRGGRM